MKLISSSRSLSSQGALVFLRSSACQIPQLQLRAFITEESRDVRLNLVDQGDKQKYTNDLRIQSRCRVYKKDQELWPSLESYEQSLTQALFHQIECAPLESLPCLSGSQREDNERQFLVEGPGALKLLQSIETERTYRKKLALAEGDRLTDGDGDLLSTFSGNNQVIEQRSQEEQGQSLSSFSSASHNSGIHHEQHSSLINNKMIIPTKESLKGSTLESFIHSKRILLNDLQTSPQTSTGESLWDAVPHLDPFIATRAAQCAGPTATCVQAYLLQVLLNEDHNDVLFNASVGTGKTTALLIAALNAVRTETAGVNIIVAGNAAGANRMAVLLTDFCGEFGGTVADRKVEDWKSWFLLAPEVENAWWYDKMMRKSSTDPQGTLRLMITTPPVLAELFFQHRIGYNRLSYLRRVFFDDIELQLRLPPSTASTFLKKERLANPLTIEMLLATLHQMPLPHIRANLQLGIVGSSVDGYEKEYLDALCLKQQSKTIIMTPMRLPSSIHCIFSFYTTLGHVHKIQNNLPDINYAFQYISATRSTIPGRAVVFIDPYINLLTARTELRRLGMDCKVLSEVYNAQTATWKQPWKFLVIHENESYGVELPLVSHVFITFPPSCMQNYMMMAGVSSRVGSVGWTTVLCHQKHAPHVRVVAEELFVDFTGHVLDSSLNPVPKNVVEGWSKPLEPLGMHPQKVVKEFYDLVSEPGSTFISDTLRRDREIVEKYDMMRCDYEPLAHKERRFRNVQRLYRDVNKDPTIVTQLQNQHFLDESMKPTPYLKEMLTRVRSDGRTGSIPYKINKPKHMSS